MFEEDALAAEDVIAGVEAETELLGSSPSSEHSSPSAPSEDVLAAVGVTDGTAAVVEAGTELLEFSPSSEQSSSLPSSEDAVVLLAVGAVTVAEDCMLVRSVVGTVTLVTDESAADED